MDTLAFSSCYQDAVHCIAPVHHTSTPCCAVEKDPSCPGAVHNTLHVITAGTLSPAQSLPRKSTTDPDEIKRHIDTQITELGAKLEYQLASSPPAAAAAAARASTEDADSVLQQARQALAAVDQRLADAGQEVHARMAAGSEELGRRLEELAAEVAAVQQQMQASGSSHQRIAQLEQVQVGDCLWC
jgi:hypothetical protein